MGLFAIHYIKPGTIKAIAIIWYRVQQKQLEMSALYMYGSFYFVSCPKRGRRYRPGYFPKTPIVTDIIEKYPGAPFLDNKQNRNSHIYIYIYIYTERSFLIVYLGPVSNSCHGLKCSGFYVMYHNKAQQLEMRTIRHKHN